MRKITIFLAGLLTTISALASSELTLAPFYAWGEGMHVKDNEVTCDNDKSWQSAQIWLEQDLSEYDYIWMEMNACQGPFELAIEYDVSGNAATQSVNIESGEYVAYIALDAEKKGHVNKIELKNREDGGSMTIAGIYAGTTDQWQAAMADFREALNFQYFGEWYDADFDLATMKMTITKDNGARSWWSIGNKSDCYKAVVNFATATTAGGNLTVTYNGSATQNKTDFYDNTTHVEVVLDGTLKSDINQIYIQGAEAGSTYTFKDAYLMKTPTTPMAVREGEGIRNLGQFKGNNDGLDVDGNTITWNKDKSWKGCDSWIRQDLRDNDYVWMLMDVEGQIRLMLQYGDDTGEEMEVYEGAPYVGFHLNQAKDQVAKLMAQNMTNGGKLVIKGVYAGSEEEYTAMMNSFTTSMNWDDFGNLWNASVNGKTFQMTQEWGGAGWRPDKDYSQYTKVIAEFDGPTAIEGNFVVEYEKEYQDQQEAPATKTRFSAAAHRVEITLDAEKKRVVKQIYFSCENTENSVTLKEVRLLKATDNEISLDENNTEYHNDKVLALYDGFQCNVTLNRQFTADNAWYTLCLPFDLNEEQIAASFGDCQIMQLTESYLKGEDALYLQFDEVATIEAGKPYLFMPANDISSVSFAGVTINATEPTAYPVGTQLATMTGTYTRPQLSTDKYVLIADNTLAPSDGKSWMLAFRAWFDLNPSVHQVQARCVFGRQTPTELEKAAIAVPAAKYMQNGKVYILRNNNKYNLMGQIVK